MWAIEILAQSSFSHVKTAFNVFEYDKFEFDINGVNARNTFASIFPVTQPRAAYYPDLQVQASCMNSANEHHVDVCHPEPVCFNHPRTAPQRCKSTPHISPRGPCRPAGITPRAARPGWCHWPPQSHGRRRPYRRCHHRRHLHQLSYWKPHRSTFQCRRKRRQSERGCPNEAAAADREGSPTAPAADRVPQPAPLAWLRRRGAARGGIRTGGAAVPLRRHVPRRRVRARWVCVFGRDAEWAGQVRGEGVRPLSLLKFACPPCPPSLPPSLLLPRLHVPQQLLISASVK